MTLQTRPLTGCVGLEILGLNLRGISPAQAAEIADCLDRGIGCTRDSTEAQRLRDEADRLGAG